MKPVSEEELKRNRSLMRANAPPPKRSKTSGNPNPFSNVDEWMEDNSVSSILGSPINNVYNAMDNSSLPSTPMSTTSSVAGPPRLFPSSSSKNPAKNMLRRSLHSSFQRKSEHTSTNNNDNSNNLSIIDNPRMAFLSSVHLRDQPPSTQIADSLLKTTQTNSNIDVSYNICPIHLTF